MDRLPVLFQAGYRPAEHHPCPAEHGAIPGEIREVLEYDDLQKIVGFLERAERKRDEKIAELQYCKAKIQLARKDYEKKRQGRQPVDGPFLQEFPERVILLSHTLEAPTLENLGIICGIFTTRSILQKGNGTILRMWREFTQGREVPRLFAVCIRHGKAQSLLTLPAGAYLCADCTEENRGAVVDGLMRTARQAYGAEPEFTVQLIVVSGILQWNYQAQVYLGNP